MNNKVMLAMAALALLIVMPVRAADHCSHLQVKLIIKKNELKVTPTKPKCLFSGEGFDIAVKPPGAAARGDITVEEKQGVSLAIQGNNDAEQDTVAVTVSGDADPDISYGYTVEVAGHGVLDPEVRIVTSRMLMLNSLMDEVDALLEEEMGFSLMELNDKQKELKEIEGMQNKAE